VTTRLDDTWKKWSTPKNLGKEFNTFNGDWGYVISTDGTKAYSASAKDGLYDLYVADLPENLRPKAVATIRGWGEDPADYVTAEIRGADRPHARIDGVTDQPQARAADGIPPGVEVVEDVHRHQNTKGAAHGPLEATAPSGRLCIPFAGRPGAGQYRQPTPTFEKKVGEVSLSPQPTRSPISRSSVAST
jgi:hypothetical protein